MSFTPSQRYSELRIPRYDRLRYAAALVLAVQIRDADARRAGIRGDCLAV